MAFNIFSFMGDAETEFSSRRHMVDGEDPLMRQLLSEAKDALEILGDTYDAALRSYAQQTNPLNPGDITFPVSGRRNWSFRNPCASYLWYLREPSDIILELDIPDDDSISLLLDRIDIKPVKVLHDPADMKSGVETLYEMRYETLVVGRSLQFPVNMPTEVRDYIKENPGFAHLGTIDLYFGQICSVEVLSMVGEETGDGEGALVCDDGGERMFPPTPHTFFVAPGIEISSYTGAKNSIFIQFGVEGFPGEQPSGKGFRNYNWARLYLTNDFTWPTPGEFLGMAVKPMPNKPWYYQLKSPFLYTANWFETEYYSSGIVTTVYDEGDPAGIGTVGKTYEIRIKEQSGVLAKSSDFAVYAVGDRVALVKVIDSANQSHKWTELGDFTLTWVIYPITFYED